ncbi:hypothetical protein I302_108574 [Kwoniella bestiolae CBS 10118]|uniref:Major facilitator superfamily (MFS) profile domain-containing protein n=1 Tax=Kwoniella bestiolae CBS 10118 TaxID=1296100 RepID=A0A1B9FVB3_9TREE|nr:hypothetical protein I302_07053 [Kwoniella bestiolae CBS 10118]OCF22713.1 hypothetical protein I302_07053 [Kwoniella bestiolae CBS 10118]
MSDLGSQSSSTATSTKARTPPLLRLRPPPLPPPHCGTTSTPISSAALTVGPQSVMDDLEVASQQSDLALGHSLRVFLLCIFALSVFVDVLASSAFSVFTGPISQDLSIVFAQQSWVITSYAVTFASFLPFWGRVSDIFSPKPVFCFGFLAVGIANIILSFLTERISFFVIRALTGIAAASLVPTAYRLIHQVFPPEERGWAYTVYGMTGSIANVTGTIIAGLIDFIPNGGQMRSWRWFFRIVAAVCIPSAIFGYFLIPADRSSAKHVNLDRELIKRLDLIGISTMLSSIILIILGLTLGASYGWTYGGFLAPLILGIVLLPTFFLWESRREEENALLPSSIWRIPNVTVLVIFALITLGWWSVNFIPYIEMFVQVHGERTIIAAVRTLPEGLIAGTVSVILITNPKLIAHPRLPITVAMLLCIAASIIWCQAPDVVGMSYWRYVFPGMIIGSGGMQVVLLSTNVGIMLAAPSERTGILGAILQMSMQTSSVVALSIQAGLLSIHPGGIYDIRNVQASWYFEMGWTALWLAGFLIFYKPSAERHV